MFWKKILIGAVMSAVLIPSANAEEVLIENVVTLSYPDQVKLKKSGCQEVPVKFVTDDNLSRENTFFFAAITPMKNKRALGYSAWFSKQTYLGDKSLPPMARIGTLKLKICRKAFMYSTSASKKTPGVNPGIYRIFLNAGQLDPKTGVVTGEKIETIRSIEFY